MKIASRLNLILFSASALPILVFAAFIGVFKAGLAPALAAAAAAAALASFFSVRLIMSGVARPVMKVSSNLKNFIASDYRLESVIPKAGWPEAASLISGLNRLMLELSAFRAFHINQLLEDRSKAQALIETITDGVLLVDPQGQLIYSNKKALNLLCIPKQDPLITLPGSVRQEAFLAALTGIMASTENNLKAEVEIKSQDEIDSITKNFLVLAKHFSLTTLKGPGRIIVLRDVTVEKGLENARETLFHMITHDMRAPLSSIQGYAQMLKKSVTAAVDAKCVDTILRSASRLNGMIGDILNTIKLEHGEMKLTPVTIDAGELCARVFEVHQPLAARKGIKLTAPPPPGRIDFTGDAMLIERVITNLLGNSIKFTPEEGAISLACRLEGGQVLFSVEDNGPGIPKSKHAEIFEKYAQLDEHKFMGFGLGLAMCKMAVELHKGRIWIESEEGKGSKFVFSIPAQ